MSETNGTAPRTVTDATRLAAKEAIALRAAGKTVAEIGETLGVDRGSASRLSRGLNHNGTVVVIEGHADVTEAEMKRRQARAAASMAKTMAKRKAQRQAQRQAATTATKPEPTPTLTKPGALTCSCCGKTIWICGECLA